MAARGRVRYTGNEASVMNIADFNLKTVSGKGTDISGFDINGSFAFSVKRNVSLKKSVLIRMNEYAEGKVLPTEANTKGIPYMCYGLAYYAQNVYLTTDSGKIVKTSYDMADTATEVYNVTDANGNVISGFRTKAIAKATGTDFILLENTGNTDYLCFSECVLDAANKKLVQKRKFYVKNTGYTDIQDIYFDAKYGLFIVENKISGGMDTLYNMILRVKLERKDEEKYAGCDLYYPMGVLYIVGSTSLDYYKVTSMSIAPKGAHAERLYFVCKKGTGSTNAELAYLDNMAFRANGPFEYNMTAVKKADIPDVHTGRAVCTNPGAFTLSNNVGYCVTSYTDTADDALFPELSNRISVLLKSDDIDNQNFEPVMNPANPLTNLGHANGLEYYDGSLYVAAYCKTPFVQKNVVKLSLDGTVEKVYSMDRCYGGISHYKDEKFILANYENFPTGEKYAETPEFVIGSFDDVQGIFNITECFKVNNPCFIAGKTNVLQDIHYSPEWGLYFITRCGGVDKVVRVYPETIEQALRTGGSIDADEVYNSTDALHEIEAVCISASGKLYMAVGSNEENKDAVYMEKEFRFA